MVVQRLSIRAYDIQKIRIPDIVSVEDFSIESRPRYSAFSIGSLNAKIRSRVKIIARVEAYASVNATRCDTRHGGSRIKSTQLQ